MEEVSALRQKLQGVEQEREELAQRAESLHVAKAAAETSQVQGQFLPDALRG